jgi:hypothetical protein
MTSSEQAQHVAEIVKSALERTTEDARVFLDQACTGDPETRAEVDSLLKFQAQANGFIERGALDLAAESLAQDGSLAGEEMIGDYKILSKIGAGGWATSTSRKTFNFAEGCAETCPCRDEHGRHRRQISPRRTYPREPE